MYNSNQEENSILAYWETNNVFSRSISERPENKPYHFYDGPPFATGLPHYGHIVGSVMKDVIPRYWTMKGYRVERKWGWDCHGLPVENIVENDLGLNCKKAIEDYGVGKFNEACRSAVLTYVAEWKKTIRRIGRWVDMENDYKTMDPEYMESVWWVFSQLWKQGLIYRGHKAMHVCPRCVTPLANFEVTQGYKDTKDISVTAKFKVLNPDKYNLPDNTNVLAWTTTPWTLPGNVLLAVNEKILYVLVRTTGDTTNYIAAKDRIVEVMKDKQYETVKELSGADLVGMEYEPLFPYYADTKNAFRVVSAEFVTTTDGTGVVHIAPAFGEDDYKVGKAEGVELVQHVSMEGKFVEEVIDFAGKEVKPTTDSTATDVEIIKWLAANDKLFSKEKFEHSYPYCWRCDTPLINYATASWFVKVTDIKEQLIKNNQGINWVPDHIKEGRFGQWLEGARDWAISRNRFWGDPIPVWESEDGDMICIGSIKELEELTGVTVTDLHKHIVDQLEIVKDGKVYKRVPEVLDCWFESGSMPYGQMHYPFENKEKFIRSFPAEFIAEGQDQTRGWFYTLHVLATALTSGKTPSIALADGSVPAFKNVIVNGIVLAEDGKKMSKRLKNYPEPEVLLDKYGADAMRYYLLNSPVMTAENLNFSEAGVREIYNKLINTVVNVLEFYQMYKTDQLVQMPSEKNILDAWIMAKLRILNSEVTEAMDGYRLPEASRSILEFVTELSQWYVRRSRDRFKGDNQADKTEAVNTLGTVLRHLSLLLAPFTPFLAEKIFLTLGVADGASVHLENWPLFVAKEEDRAIIAKMESARTIVELGLAMRAQAGIKVRQPLSSLTVEVSTEKSSLGSLDVFSDIISEEMNVLSVKWEPVQDGSAIKEDGGFRLSLDTVITPELKSAGLVRELVRTINQKRKEMNLTIGDRAKVLYYTVDPELLGVVQEHKEAICSQVLAVSLEENATINEMQRIGEAEIGLVVEKI